MNEPSNSSGSYSLIGGLIPQIQQHGILQVLWKITIIPISIDILTRIVAVTEHPNTSKVVHIKAARTSSALAERGQL